MNENAILNEMNARNTKTHNTSKILTIFNHSDNLWLTVRGRWINKPSSNESYVYVDRARRNQLIQGL